MAISAFGVGVLVAVLTLIGLFLFGRSARNAAGGGSGGVWKFLLSVLSGVISGVIAQLVLKAMGAA